MADAIPMYAKSAVVLQVGQWRKRFPVIVISHGRQFSRVRFLVDCEPLGLRKGNADIVSTELLVTEGY